MFVVMYMLSFLDRPENECKLLVSVMIYGNTNDKTYGLRIFVSRNVKFIFAELSN